MVIGEKKADNIMSDHSIKKLLHTSLEGQMNGVFSPERVPLAHVVGVPWHLQ